MLPKMLPEIGFADVIAVGAHHAEQGPLIPLRMGNSDGRGLRHGGRSGGGGVGGIHSPPDLITSFDRSVICIVPSG